MSWGINATKVPWQAQEGLKAQNESYGIVRHNVPHNPDAKVEIAQCRSALPASLLELYKIICIVSSNCKHATQGF